MKLSTVSATFALIGVVAAVPGGLKSQNELGLR
jgi:hypothetical protein